MFSVKQKPKRPDTADFHSRAVLRVISTVRNRLDESISLKEMASVAYMSRFHFNRTFREITGLPPRRFVSALRLQSAARMLLDTDIRVTDICLNVGYNSLGTFVRRFSETLGVSPLRLRAMQRSPGQDLLHQAEGNTQSTPSESGSSVVGRILSPISYSGPIFVGLFAGPIPEGVPVASAIQYSPGTFRIACAPRGDHYLFAVGLPLPETIIDFFRHDSALRGGGERVCVDRDVVECGDICLRAPIPSDPPILVNLLVLLKKAQSLREVTQTHCSAAQGTQINQMGALAITQTGHRGC